MNEQLAANPTAEPPAETACPLFRVFQLHEPPADSAYALWVESTATLNVDDPPPPSSLLPDPALQEVDAAQAVHDLAGFLNGQEQPEIVITVHGFNNPLDVVRKRYGRAFAVVNVDAGIPKGRGLVCIGYKWPSEPMFTGPWKSSLSAMPGALLGLNLIAGVCGLLSLSARLWQSPPLVASLSSLLGRGLYLLLLVIFCIPFAAVLLRSVVYFRDSYRAANYGVLDLVELIRQVDKALFELDPQKWGQDSWQAGRDGHRPDRDFGDERVRRVKLSFIGHSMGAAAVTQLVRILSDVFDPNSVRPLSTVSPEKRINPQLGHVFSLGRLVLVSPDIPAETLMMRCANFLAPSLLRFEEVYLFSNAGDEVLRMIATVANYFSFPNKSRRYGFRLGNVEVLGDAYGIVNRSDQSHTVQEFLQKLRIGDWTLWQLHANLIRPGSLTTSSPNPDNFNRTASPPTAGEPSSAKAASSAPASASHAVFPASTATSSPPPGEVPARRGTGSSTGSPAGVPVTQLPLRFTYFDCTDYVDVDMDAIEKGRAGCHIPRGLLSHARKKPQLQWWDNWGLLLDYLRADVDVHSGYFSGPFTQQMIYRLACLGLRGTLSCALPGQDISQEADWDRAMEVLSEQCRKKQIKVLLSENPAPQ